MTKRKWISIILWLPTLAWTALLFGFSGQDGQESGRLSLQVTLFIMRIFPGLPCDPDTLHFIVRKAAHFTIFGAEGVLLSASLIHSRVGLRTAAMLSAPLCAVIAALNEYHQSFADGRHPSPADAAIDFAGALFGILLVQAAIRLLRRRNAKGS